ncbi:hypothetical protein ZWY2020_012456 [Hordeum vulgare]|nr:hypothetical protein ZWY2020_012456 [Hordeum vulgare]
MRHLPDSLPTPPAQVCSSAAAPGKLFHAGVGGAATREHWECVRGLRSERWWVDAAPARARIEHEEEWDGPFSGNTSHKS